MYKNDAINVFTALFAILFCALFAVSSYAAAASSSVAEMLKPSTVADIVTSIDIEDAVLENTTTDRIIKDMNVSDDAFEDFMKSDAAEELIETVTEGLYDSLTGDGDEEYLTEKDIRDIVDDHMDEIIDIAEEHAEGEFSREKAEEDIRMAVDENARDIIKALPTAEDIAGEVTDDFTLAADFVSGPKMTVLFALFSLLFALIIFALRHRRCRGLIWIGSACAVTSVFMILTSAAANWIVGNADFDIDAMGVDIIDRLLSVLAEKFLYAFVITIALAAVLIAVGILVNVITGKKNATPPPQPNYCNNYNGYNGYSNYNGNNG